MLTKVWASIDGFKTYILAGLGVLVALAGHFWGPFPMAGQTIPQFSWSEVWNVVWGSSLAATLRAGISKAQG